MCHGNVTYWLRNSHDGMLTLERMRHVERGGCSGVTAVRALALTAPPSFCTPGIVVATCVTSQPAVRVVMSARQNGQFPESLGSAGPPHARQTATDPETCVLLPAGRSPSRPLLVRGLGCAYRSPMKRGRRSSPDAPAGGDTDQATHRPPLALRTAWATASAGRRAMRTARVAGEAAGDAVAEVAGAAVEVVAEVASDVISNL